ncbi:MAG: hypothetical protein IPG50_28045 [Myxococcales bacterium]|nr:hypothetical protein [Myxococcales bacterium]
MRTRGISGRSRTPTNTYVDSGLPSDASTDAGRGKGRSGKKKGGPGKPRGGNGPKPSHRGGASGVGLANTNESRSKTNDESDDDDSDEFRPPFRGRGPAGPTYEAALASNKQEITIGGRQVPDLTDAQLSRPMRSGAFVGECGAPDSMKVQVRVAIRNGRPAGVSVSTTPPHPDIAGCIRGARLGHFSFLGHREHLPWLLGWCHRTGRLRSP